VHEAAQTFVITAAGIVDFHLDLELFLWRLHLVCFHIALATIPLFFTTTRMPRRIITDVSSAIMARQLLNNCR